MKIRLQGVEPGRLAEAGKLAGIMLAAWGWLLLLLCTMADVGEWVTK